MFPWIHRKLASRTVRNLLLASWLILLALGAVYALSMLSDLKFVLVMMYAGIGVLGLVVGWAFMESPRSAFKVQKLEDDLSRLERDLAGLREDHDELHEMHSRKDLQLHKTKRELKALREDTEAILRFGDSNQFRQALPLIQAILSRTQRLDIELRSLPAPGDGSNSSSN